MIGNFSFEEHDRYFTRMYNHLKFIDRTLDDATIINVIKSKVMIEQELENIMYNLNIKNISDTPIVKDFKIWSTKYDLYSEAQSEDENSETQSEAQSNEYEDNEDEYEIDSSEVQSETQSEDEIDSDDKITIDDIYDYYGIDEVRRCYGNSAAQRYYENSEDEDNTTQRYRDISDIPDDY